MAGEYAPVLHTPRLTLTISKPQDKDELTFLLGCLNDPTAHALMGDMGVHTIPQLQALNTSTQLLPEHTPHKEPTAAPAQYIVRLGSDEPNGQPIGLVSLGSREYEIPPDIGWLILGQHQGKGYATEAAQTLLLYFMNTFQGGFRNAVPPLGIIAFPSENNLPSIRVAEKIGLVPMGFLGGAGEEAHVVYGSGGLGTNGGKPFTLKQKVNLYGPGKAGRRAKELIEGGGTKWDPASAGFARS